MTKILNIGAKILNTATTITFGVGVIAIGLRLEDIYQFNRTKILNEIQDKIVNKKYVDHDTTYE